MAESKTNNVHPVLSTWQWLGVICVIIGGTIGIDQRMQATVKLFADANKEDHQRIRSELAQLASDLPPPWLVKKVEENTADARNVRDEIEGIRIGLVEINQKLKQLLPKGTDQR